MSRIIRQQDGAWAIVDDAWHVLRPDAATPLPVPAELDAGQVLVPLAYWLANREALIATRPAGSTGVWLASGDEPADLEGALDGLALIAIDFPAFTDGRGYSSAVLLRTRLGWRGELRAIGDVLRDQLAYMARTGFDAFVVRADKSIEDALAAFAEFPVRYQGSVDEPAPLFRRRQAGVAGAAA